MKNFKDIKIGDKFIHTAFNKVDSYDKSMYPLETKKRNVVEVVHINESEYNSQIVLKYVNGTGSIFIYEWINAANFNSTYKEWPDIEITNFYVYRTISNNNIFFVNDDKNHKTEYYDERPHLFKKIGVIHHDYDKNNDRDELSLSDI